MSGIEEIKNNLRFKTKNQEGIFVYLPKITEFQKKEKEFHNQHCQDEEEIHQLSALRNRYYHNYFKKWVYQLPKESVILEIGSGSGNDIIPLLNQGYSLIASDISYNSLSFIKNKIDQQFLKNDGQIIYLVADGEQLPLEDNSVDAVYMVATLHHFEKPNEILNEILRVSKSGGLIIFAMEPSRLMMWFTKLFRKSKKLRIHQGYSVADETHPGYIKSDWKVIAGSQSSVIKIKRVWFLFGFLHYGLEALFRLLKLKKRIKIPNLIEWALLIIDEIILKIPLINQLNWHWIVVIIKH